MAEQKQPETNKLLLVLIGLAILTIFCLIVGAYGWSYVSEFFSSGANPVRK